MPKVELVPVPLPPGFIVYEGILPDGRHVSIYPLTYGRARLTVGRGRDMWDQAW